MAYEDIARHLAGLGVTPISSRIQVPVDDRVWRQIRQRSQARIPDVVRWMFARFAGCGFSEGAFYFDPRYQADAMFGWFLDGAELLATFENTRDILTSDVIPISDDGGDNHLAVGVGPENSGTVYFHAHDAPIGTHLYTVNESIDRFLLSLHRNELPYG